MSRQNIDPSQVLQTVLLAKGSGIELSKDAEKLLSSFLQRNLAALESEEASIQKHRLEAVQMAREEIEMRRKRRERCPHRKEDGKSALFGQRLSNGQECLICLKCGSDFFDPPKKELGQVSAPPHLTQNRKFVGMQLNK